MTWWWGEQSLFTIVKVATIVHPEAHNPSPDPTHRNYSSTFSSVPSHKSMHESPCLLVASDYL